MIVLSNVVVPSDGIRISQHQTVAFIENERCGEGDLIISEGLAKIFYSAVTSDRIFERTGLLLILLLTNPLSTKHETP
uniref:Cyclic nucleotide-binding domain-containing protein n=1 Tax=Ascaris lumbricoides TaxID=6252 RepID=A0A0M3IIY7_ASCLU